MSSHRKEEGGGGKGGKGKEGEEEGEDEGGGGGEGGRRGWLNWRGERREEEERGGEKREMRFGIGYFSEGGVPLIIKKILIHPFFFGKFFKTWK